MLFEYYSIPSYIYNREAGIPRSRACLKETRMQNSRKEVTGGEQGVGKIEGVSSQFFKEFCLTKGRKELLFNWGDVLELSKKDF